ncbi:MAG: CinA family protein [Pseudomonadota bacterium]
MSAADLFHLAKAGGRIIATAESCTGGMVSAAITDIAGSSAIFDRGFVTYSNDAKMVQLGVRADTLQSHGAVSEAVAGEMAQGALANSAANVAVSITGIAGPGGSDHKPEGRVCFGIATQNECQTETVEFGALGRANVRQSATAHALKMLIAQITEGEP